MGLFKKREELVVGWDEVAALADIAPRKRGSKCPVVGGFAYADAWAKVTGGWTDTRTSVNEAVLVKVAPDPKNAEDPDALVVTAAGMTIGYVPREMQQKMRKVLDEHGGSVQLLGILDCYQSSDPSKPWFDRYDMNLSIS